MTAKNKKANNVPVNASNKVSKTAGASYYDIPRNLKSSGRDQISLNSSYAEDIFVNKKRWIIEIQHLATGDSVAFKSFLTEFADSFNSNWNSEEIFGRMDPILIFKNTKRTISIGWDIPANDVAEARYNMIKINNLMKMLYPVYGDIKYQTVAEPSARLTREISNSINQFKKTSAKKGGQQAAVRRFIQDISQVGVATSNFGAQSTYMVASPLLKMKFTNLISQPGGKVVADVDSAGLVGTVDGFVFQPDLEAGFFDPGASMLFPKLVKLQCNFTVLHTHKLGYPETKTKSVFFYDNNPERFPYSITDAPPPGRKPSSFYIAQERAKLKKQAEALAKADEAARLKRLKEQEDLRNKQRDAIRRRLAKEEADRIKAAKAAKKKRSKPKQSIVTPVGPPPPPLSVKEVTKRVDLQVTLESKRRDIRDKIQVAKNQLKAAEKGGNKLLADLARDRISQLRKKEVQTAAKLTTKLEKKEDAQRRLEKKIKTLQQGMDKQGEYQQRVGTENKYLGALRGFSFYKDAAKAATKGTANALKKIAGLTSNQQIAYENQQQKAAQEAAKRKKKEFLKKQAEFAKSLSTGKATNNQIKNEIDRIKKTRSKTWDASVESVKDARRNYQKLLEKQLKIQQEAQRKAAKAAKEKERRLAASGALGLGSAKRPGTTGPTQPQNIAILDRIKRLEETRKSLIRQRDVANALSRASRARHDKSTEYDAKWAATVDKINKLNQKVRELKNKLR